jgi:hypothetical protein
MTPLTTGKIERAHDPQSVPDVWSIKHIAPPIIALGNRSDRRDKGNPKKCFKYHLCGQLDRHVKLAIYKSQQQQGDEIASLLVAFGSRNF